MPSNFGRNARDVKAIRLRKGQGLAEKSSCNEKQRMRKRTLVHGASVFEKVVLRVSSAEYVSQQIHDFILFHHIEQTWGHG